MQLAPVCAVPAALTLLSFLSTPSRVHASSSGLNNIPTADTAPHRTLVFQGYPTFGAHRRPIHFAGFKFGIDPWQQSRWRNRFEFGLDSYLGSGDAGPAVLQFKVTTQPCASGPALTAGVANMASTSKDRLRAANRSSMAWSPKTSACYGSTEATQRRRDNNTVLIGADRNFKLLNRDLIVRGDAVQIERRKNCLASFGGLYAFSKHLVLESWWNQPAHGSPGSITIKLNFVIVF